MMEIDENSKASINKNSFFTSEKNSRKLIKLVHERPFLYDYHIPHIKKQEKSQLWEQISLELNVDVNECKNRWKNLRDTYNMALKSHRLSSKWKYAKDLAFLQNIYSSRKKSRKEALVSSPIISNPVTEANVDNQQEYEIEEIYFEDKCEYDLKETDINIFQDNNKSEGENSDHESLLISSPTSNYNNYFTKFLKKRSSLNCNKTENKTIKKNLNAAHKNSGQFKHFCQCIKEMDDIDLFLEYTNKKIRNFSTTDISHIQKIIMDAIFKFEMNNLNSNK